MKAVFTPTVGMTGVDTSYCPGCTHGIAHRIIMECLEERGALGKTIGVAPIGCAINAHHFMNVDMCESMHGRAPAIASGIRRVHPDKIVFTYQGDGDRAAIGIAEIVHAALRGEKFTTFFINNGIYGMTGGQMAPTTLVGQKATTAVNGRDPAVAGKPLRVSELLSTIDGAVFVERVMLNNPANVRRAKEAVRKALDVQEAGLGFSFVEFLSSCPTNWGLAPRDALHWVETEMAAYYPVQNFRKPEDM